MARRIGAASYVECSALSRYNVNSVFAQAARVSLTYQKSKNRKGSLADRSTHITPTSGSRKRKLCLLQ